MIVSERANGRLHRSLLSTSSSPIQPLRNVVARVSADSEGKAQEGHFPYRFSQHQEKWLTA
jgi:hypothetical protein